jgi:hypothetical protein
MPSAEMKIFGDAAFYLDIIDSIAPVALGHTYHFMTDDAFAKWKGSDDFSWETFNAITSFELIDKAHLAAMTALLRTKRWATAVCLMENLLAEVTKVSDKTLTVKLLGSFFTTTGLADIPKSAALPEAAG